MFFLLPLGFHNRILKNSNRLIGILRSRRISMSSAAETQRPPSAGIFAPLAELPDGTRYTRLKGVVFDVDGTLW
jgi:hypothetical protein